MLKVLNKEISSQCELDTLYNRVKENLSEYPYFHYRYYPSKDNHGWINLFLDELKKSFTMESHFVIYEDSEITPIFIIYHINKWDEDHFGVKMATSVNMFSFPNMNIDFLSNFIDKGIDSLRQLGVKFVSTRINGDNLSLINAHFRNGFSYYETIIWPILKVENISKKIEPCDLLKDEESLMSVKKIAEKDQYQRGHFHCDSNFDKDRVNSMYAKWVQSSFYSEDKICIIETNGNIAGYFVCSINLNLEKYLGYKYGRLKSLALDNKYRGQGLGAKLFAGTIAFLQKNGCDFIDSGFATKNHISSFLHSSNSFHSNYEELSLHFWISNDNKL